MRRRLEPVLSTVGVQDLIRVDANCNSSVPGMPFSASASGLTISERVDRNQHMANVRLDKLLDRPTPVPALKGESKPT